MSTGGEWLEGRKAYKGTIESAEQTLSFLIIFIFENAEEEKLRERYVREEPRDPIIS